MLMFGYFLKVFIISLFIAEGFCIAKWYMHTLCRRFLFDYGGELILDESLFPRHEDSCFVTIVGNGSHHNKISFFFSSFNVGSDCQGNVTLIDGIADIYTRKVPGLEKSLCKYHALNERSLFETTERYLGVMFHRRTDRWRGSANTSVTLKFVSFQNEGEPCDPEGTGKLYSCASGRCVSNDVLCQDLNPCGDFSNACEESGIQQTTTTLVISTSKYIIIGVGCFVGLLCFVQGCFIVRRCCCNRNDDDDDSVEGDKRDIPPPLLSYKKTDAPEDDLSDVSQESLYLISDTVAIECNSETRHNSDSEKKSSEEFSEKLKNVLETQTDTQLKRVFK